MKQVKLSPEAKYLLQLIKTATFEEFLTESTKHFEDEEVRNSAIVKEPTQNDSFNSKYLLAADYCIAAAAFENSSFTKELHNLPWDSYLDVMYKNPILWGKSIMNEFRLRLVKSSNNTENEGANIATQLFNQILANEKYGEKWQKVFWYSFFEGIEKKELSKDREIIFDKIIRSIHTIISFPGGAHKDQIVRCHKMLLISFALQTNKVMQTIASPRDVDFFLEEAYRMVDFHPYFYKLMAYPSAKKITLTFAKKINSELVMRVRRNNFLSWSMVLEACKAVHYMMLCGLQTTITLDDLLDHVTSVDAVAKNLEQLKSRQDLFFQKEYCVFTDESVYSKYQTAQDFCKGVLKDYWHHMVPRIAITEKNLTKIVELQSLFYKSDWNDQFKDITTDNFKLALSYVEKMSDVVKNQSWDREIVLGYISKSHVWKTYPIATTIEIYYKHRSLPMYTSILERNSSELPHEWLREKHLLELIQSSFSQKNHSHERILG